MTGHPPCFCEWCDRLGWDVNERVAIEENRAAKSGYATRRPRFWRGRHLIEYDENEKVATDCCSDRRDDASGGDLGCAGRRDFCGSGARAGESGAAEAAGAGT